MRKLSTLTLAFALTASMPAFAVDLSNALEAVKKETTTENASSDALVKYAAQQLGLPEDSVHSGVGALLKVAQDQLSDEHFDLIKKAIPNAHSLIDKAPKFSASSLTSMLNKGDGKGQTAASLGYLNKAFDSLGIPKAKMPSMANAVSGFMSNNGFGEEAKLLKQGLKFL